MEQTASKQSSNPVALWQWIINIGVTPETSPYDVKRAHLINGISAWAFSVFLVYAILYATADEGRYIFYESVVACIFYLLPALANHYRRYDLACHAFNVFNIVFYLFLAITGGGRDASEYIFFTSSVSAMLFFRSQRIVILYFVVSLLCFGISKVAHAYIGPIFFYEGQRYIYYANHTTTFIILFMIINYFRSENARQENQLEARNVSLSVEKQKSDTLLLNILPHETAEELKHTGKAQSRSFSQVTVMFTDFKNFTSAAERLPPEALVREIHEYFSMFDQITSKYNIEKIKTIGDSYMCAGGIPQANETHHKDVVRAALEIQAFMKERKQARENQGELFFELRLGIHTGPVVAGIVGTKKFAYDIWGDTVNVASRMESHGVPGKVNISGSTYECVKDEFHCVYRGKIEAKNKGEVDMYFVEGPIAV